MKNEALRGFRVGQVFRNIWAMSRSLLGMWPTSECSSSRLNSGGQKVEHVGGPDTCCFADGASPLPCVFLLMQSVFGEVISKHSGKCKLTHHVFSYTLGKKHMRDLK